MKVDSVWVDIFFYKSYLPIKGNVHTKFGDSNSNVLDTAGDTRICGQTDRQIAMGHPQFGDSNNAFGY